MEIPYLKNSLEDIEGVTGLGHGSLREVDVDGNAVGGAVEQVDAGASSPSTIPPGTFLILLVFLHI